MTLAIDYFGVGWDGAEAASSWYWVVAVIAVSVEARVQIDATIIALNILDKHQLVINLIKLRCQNEAGGHDQVKGPRILQLPIDALVLRSLIQKEVVEEFDCKVLRALPLLEPGTQAENSFDNFVSLFHVGEGHPVLTDLL